MYTERIWIGGFARAASSMTYIGATPSSLAVCLRHAHACARYCMMLS